MGPELMASRIDKDNFECRKVSSIFDAMTTQMNKQNVIVIFNRPGVAGAVL